jgi:hypothetical protein
LLAPTVARADAFQCVSRIAKSSFNPSNFKKAAEFQLKYGQCTPLLADPTGEFAAALTAVGFAMAKGWLPQNAEACIGAIPNAAAKLMLALIESASSTLGIQVPNDLKAKLKSKTQSEVNDAYQQLLNQFPVLKAIAGMFHCACAIDAYGRDLLDGFLDTAKSCGAFVSDLAETVKDAGEVVGGLGCALASAVGACSFEGSETQCMGATCSMGQQCYALGINTSELKISFGNPNALCEPCGKIQFATPLEPSLCGCPKNFTASYVKWAGQFLLKSCTCPAPHPISWDFASGLICGCPDGQQEVGGKCKLTCGPNMRPVSQALTYAGGIQAIKQECAACPPQQKSDGEGPCISCAGDKSFVAKNACHTCKAWQTVHLATTKAGGSRCDDICPNGVYLPAVVPKAHAATKQPQAAAPWLDEKDQTDPSAIVAKQQGPLPTKQTPLPPEWASKQDCAPCEGNSYTLNNECHACGNHAIADIFAHTCKSCEGRQVAKHIKGAWVCAADCSKIGLRGNARPASNYIADPNERTKCIPCASGSKPNADHTACVFSASATLPKGPVAKTDEPVMPSVGGERPKQTKADSSSRQKARRVVCPLGMRRNPRGDGCLPNVRPPDIGKFIKIAPGAPRGGMASPQSRRPR